MYRRCRLLLSRDHWQHATHTERKQRAKLQGRQTSSGHRLELHMLLGIVVRCCQTLEIVTKRITCYQLNSEMAIMGLVSSDKGITVMSSECIHWCFNWAHNSWAASTAYIWSEFTTQIHGIAYLSTRTKFIRTLEIIGLNCTVQHVINILSAIS